VQLNKIKIYSFIDLFAITVSFDLKEYLSFYVVYALKDTLLLLDV